mmetsp:Transcript_19011/g.27416  ORF Transcript_19011/g.27416 Transcript_19011/m.27416 type:complete len:85 (+) Transcript_19011:3-257(+)
MRHSNAQPPHAPHLGPGFGQVTCELQTARKPVLINDNGKIVNEREIIESKTICVYEVCFADPSNKWKLANIQEIDFPTVNPDDW